jgi:ATP/maltotriose-dependent transcriptional regulator MalT
MAEMLDGLPGDLVSFMLRTAILDRLSAPLCEIVTKTTSSRALLASIEKRQLLLTALDHEGQWYRYHPLLAEHLKGRLESERSNELPELHRRAAHWYASQELWTEAVQHAIAAGDTNQALGWIKNCAMGLVKRGDLFTLLAWQRLFPPEVTAWRSQYQARTELGPKSLLADPLSAREGAILNLIGHGLSNKEIARNLAIAPETVKSHVKHIFVKLAAEKRAQAVARAQSLGLVTTH